MNQETKTEVGKKFIASQRAEYKRITLTPEKPLFGHRSGKQQKTHWVTFIKI